MHTTDQTTTEPATTALDTAAPAAITTPGASGVRSILQSTRPGRVKAGILMWLLGVPIPIILIILAIRGCA